jgi:hypothetical protein
MASKDKKPEKGIAFPLGDKKDRSTSTAGKMIIAGKINAHGGTALVDLLRSRDPWIQGPKV